MNNFYIKTNRIFTPIRKWSWLFILVVAFGGLWIPKLGLLMIPVMLALPLFGFAKGKYWCGNICPHGSFFDRFIQHISLNRKIPGWAKSKITMILAFSWFMYMLGGRLIKVSALWGTLPFVDKLGFIFVMNYFVVTLVGSTLALLINPRTWCNFCPMSTFQIIFYKLGKLLRLNKTTDKKVSISRKEMCHSCGKCARVCPLQLTPYLEFSEKNQFDNESCIRCSTCVKNCPAGILSLSNEDTALDMKAKTEIDGYEKRINVAAIVKGVKDLASDVKEFEFEIIGPNRMNYTPGQFVLVKIQDYPKIFRAYSILSYNEDGRQLSVTVKKVPNGYGTDIIFKTLTPGATVEIEGPMGRELVVDKKAKKVLFIAGGIGITPFVPMVRDILGGRNAAEEIKLVYGANKETDFLYDEYFSALALKYPKFEYIKVTAFDDNWPGRKGFVTDVTKEMNLEGFKVYMCGPLPMINAMRNVLEEKMISQDDVYYESA